jgi:hypothetical protein
MLGKYFLNFCVTHYVMATDMTHLKYGMINLFSIVFLDLTVNKLSIKLQFVVLVSFHSVTSSSRINFRLPLSHY